MKMKIIHVLCEGQTEQGFVENVLKPYLIANGVAAVKSVMVFTSMKKNARGGVVSYQKVVNDKPETAPSKRIIKAVEGGKKKLYNYDKPKSGKFVAQNVGIDNLRTQCHHFNEWVDKLLSH